MGPKISPQALEKLRENLSQCREFIQSHEEDPSAIQNLEARLAELKQHNTSSDKSKTYESEHIHSRQTE